MEVGKGLADLFGFAEIGDGVGDGVVVFEFEEWGEFVSGEFVDSDFYVLGEDEVDEDLLFVVEVDGDAGLGAGGAFLSGEGGKGVGDVGEDVEEIGFFGVDDLLHFRELVVAEAFFGEAFEEFFAGVGGAPERAELFFAGEEFGEVAEEHGHELLCGHGGAVGMPEGGDHHVLDLAFFSVGEFYFDFLTTFRWCGAGAVFAAVREGRRA